MNPNDLLKLVRYGDFQVIRTRVGENLFEIKRLQALMSPVWVVWYKCLDAFEFQFNHELLLSKPEILDCTMEFSTTDLNRIQQHGFSIIRKVDDSTFCLKERNKETGRWKKIGTFRNREERNQKVSMILRDNYTVLI